MSTPTKCYGYESKRASCFGSVLAIFVVLSRWPSLKSITSPTPWHNQIRQQALKEAEASNAQGISEVGPNIYVYLRTYMYDMN